MNYRQARERLYGCYITVPTMFSDPDLELNPGAIRRHVHFLLDNGICQGNGLLLAGGAAGDFSTMSFDERVQTLDTVLEAANGALPVAMGAQTTSTRELTQLAKAAERAGAEYIQVSCPFYFTHTVEDFYEYVAAAADAADIGIIVYNTYWTSAAVSFSTVEKLIEIPNVVGLKWATPRPAMEFESVVTTFSDRLSIIDNNNRFATSHMLGARSFEVHVCNYWPQWGAKLIDDLENARYIEVQQAMVREALPFYKLWVEIEQDYTSGDGYLDKLCMELVGFDSSRCRPPTRDIRQKYRERTQQMMLTTGVPNVIAA